MDIKKISRNYFRLMQGGAFISAPLSWLFNSVEIYGIFRIFIIAYIPWMTIVPFTIIGCVSIFTGVFAIGYILERSGLFKEQQSFLNNENNPEWVKSWAVVLDNQKDLKETKEYIQSLNSTIDNQNKKIDFLIKNQKGAI